MQSATALERAVFFTHRRLLCWVHGNINWRRKKQEMFSFLVFWPTEKLQRLKWESEYQEEEMGEDLEAKDLFRITSV